MQTKKNMAHVRKALNLASFMFSIYVFSSNFSIKLSSVQVLGVRQPWPQLVIDQAELFENFKKKNKNLAWYLSFYEAGYFYQTLSIIDLLLYKANSPSIYSVSHLNKKRKCQQKKNRPLVIEL